MFEWLKNWRKAISSTQPAIAEQPPPPSPPPTTFLHPALREAVAPTLPYPLAVDLQESRLFYRSLEGKVVSRSLLSGAIAWQSEEIGSPLRVTDQILWVVEGNAIAAYSITDGHLLMRSRKLGLPGHIIHSRCDLSQQTLRIDFQYAEQWMGGTPRPSKKNSAGYEINLLTGEVTQLYQFYGEPSLTTHLVDEQRAGHDFWNLPKIHEKAYALVSDEQLSRLKLQGQISKSAQLQTTSVITQKHRNLLNYRTAEETHQVTLSVFGNQPPYLKLWEATLEEFQWFPPGPARP